MPARARRPGHLRPARQTLRHRPTTRPVPVGIGCSTTGRPAAGTTLGIDRLGFPLGIGDRLLDGPAQAVAADQADPRGGGARRVV